MQTIHGIGISILFFIIGAVIPGSGDNQTDQPTDFIEVTINPSDIVYGIPQAMRDSDSVKSESVKDQALPPVRNNHKTKRKEVPSDPSKRCPALEPLLEAYGLFPVDTWSYIAWRESGCRPKAQNATWDSNGNMTYALNKDKSYDTGLLQINSSWRTVTATVCGEKATENHMQGLKQLDCNLRVARYIMEHSEGGLSNWRM